MPERELLTDEAGRAAGSPQTISPAAGRCIRGAAPLPERAGRNAADAGAFKGERCTDHIGYYERYGFTHIGTGYHPWGESSRIYAAETGSGETKGGSIKA